MTSILRPDICVIGAGSGGLSVAAAAAAFGVSVVLIEKGEMGGDCLNFGCVPSKALLAAGKQAQAMREAGMFGIDSETPIVDFSAVHRQVHGVIAEIAPNDSAGRFAALGVQVIKAETRFKDARTLIAGASEVRARRFVIATGSSPSVPDIDGLAGIRFLTNETIFDLKRRPSHLVILGGGPVGVEMAQAHRRLGSRVTVIDRSRALAGEDAEIAAIAIAALKAEGVEFLEDTAISSVEKRGRSGVAVHLSQGDAVMTVEGSHLLVALGRSANTAGLDLDKAGIAHDKKGVTVSDTLRSTNRRVYAIGDVAGGPQFTHVANYHAGLVIRAILFRLNARENRRLIPHAIYTDPEIAQIGMTEEQARAAGVKFRILRWPYAENDRARTERKTTGHIKLIIDRKERIAGVSIVGTQASDMIGMWALAMANNLRLRDVANLVLPYPTLGEIGKRAAMTYFSPVARNPLLRMLVRFLRVFG